MSHPEADTLPECAATREQRTCISRSSEVNARTACAGCQARRDSDSVIVPTGFRRSFRASRCGWKKCISVTAAFCFVFIVGGLCPGGVAAPTTQRQGSADRMEMERTKRSDSPLGRNRCGYTEQNGVDQKILAPLKVSKAAANTLGDAKEYQELMAKVKMSSDFDSAIQRHAGFPSVLEQSWYMLPDKTTGEPEYYEYALKNLPAMYKYLELLIGAMETITATSELTNAYYEDLSIRLNKTLGKMRNLLVQFDDLMACRGIQKLKSVETEELPVRPTGDTLGYVNDFLVFRDTLHFLEIMEKVFKQMSDNGH